MSGPLGFFLTHTVVIKPRPRLSNFSIDMSLISRLTSHVSRVNQPITLPSNVLLQAVERLYTLVTCIQIAFL